MKREAAITSPTIALPEPVAVGFTGSAAYESAQSSADSVSGEQSFDSEPTAASESTSTSPGCAAVIGSCGSNFSNFGVLNGAALFHGRLSL